MSLVEPGLNWERFAFDRPRRLDGFTEEDRPLLETAIARHVAYLLENYGSIEVVDIDFWGDPDGPELIEEFCQLRLDVTPIDEEEDAPRPEVVIDQIPWVGGEPLVEAGSSVIRISSEEDLDFGSDFSLTDTSRDLVIRSPFSGAAHLVTDTAEAPLELPELTEVHEALAIIHADLIKESPGQRIPRPEAHDIRNFPVPLNKAPSEVVAEIEFDYVVDEIDDPFFD